MNKKNLPDKKNSKIVSFQLVSPNCQIFQEFSLNFSPIMFVKILIFNFNFSCWSYSNVKKIIFTHFPQFFSTLSQVYVVFSLKTYLSKMWWVSSTELVISIINSIKRILNNQRYFAPYNRKLENSEKLDENAKSIKCEKL